jgi:hypothetical protein
MLHHDSQVQGGHDATFNTLAEFTVESGCEHGVALNELEPGTKITVVTTHSTYRFQLIDGVDSRASVVGGSLFAEPTEVRVEGATAGGSAIKSGWIGMGLRLELTTGTQRITTSRVTAIDVVTPLDDATHPPRRLQ